MPPVLSADYAARRSAARETITELIVADLGDEVSKTPYLIVSNMRVSTNFADNVLVTPIYRRSNNLRAIPDHF